MQIQNKTSQLIVSSFRQFTGNIALCSICANIKYKSQQIKVAYQHF